MISGFSIIKNGDRLGYPYLEALRSLAPLVDEIVVAHGDSTDSTLESLEGLRPLLSCPLKIIASPWNNSNTQGGSELARQTNIALAACSHDVCFYIQADECLHEGEYPMLREDLDRFIKRDDLDGLALRWIHFYGNFETIVESRQWYRREVRVVKKSRGIQSYGDAQGFRIFRNGDWVKPRAALSRAHMHHYGWVRPAPIMAQKSQELDRLWHGNSRDGTHDPSKIYPKIYGQKQYLGTHPKVMSGRVLALQGYDPFSGQTLKSSPKTLRLWSTACIESATGWRPGEFRNYRLVERF